MREISQAAWIAVPVTLALAFVLLSLVPVGIGPGGTLAPVFALTVVYFFAVHRPEFFPPWAVFFVGLVQDIASGGPVGLVTVMLLACYAITHSQRLFLMGKGFSTLWAGFGANCVVAVLIGWFGASVHFGYPVNPAPLIAQAALTLAVYPPASFLLTRVNRRLTALVPAA